MSFLGLEGRRALVVGCGGIGRAIALGLAEQGALVAVADNGAAHVETVAADLRALGVDAPSLVLDVTDEAALVAAARALEEVGHGLDVLVNAFGVAAREPSLDLSAARFRHVLDVNTVGTFLCCRAFGEGMIRRGGGAIVNLSSVRGRFGVRAGVAAYCAGKGAVDAMTRTLAVEWAGRGVRVNAVAPTVVETELTRAILDDEEGARELRRSVPLGRWAQPDDIVGPVLFLASASAAYVTGQILYVDGGLTAGT